MSEQEALSAMEPLSTQIVQFSRRLFGPEQNVDCNTLSPYVLLSLYQSAIVQLRLWKQTKNVVYTDALESLKEIIGFFNQRWASAGSLHFDLLVCCPATC